MNLECNTERFEQKENLDYLLHYVRSKQLIFLISCSYLKLPERIPRQCFFCVIYWPEQCKNVQVSNVRFVTFVSNC